MRVLTALVLLLALIAGCDRSGSLRGGGLSINEVMPDARRFAPEYRGAGSVVLHGAQDWSAFVTLHGTTDWVELFNPAGKKLNLGGYYLSDSRDNLRKWRFPAPTWISGYEAATREGGFLVVPIGGDLTGFGLGGGDDVFLTAPDGETIVDWVDVPELDTDIAWAVDPDNSRRYTETWQATSGTPNKVGGLYLRVVNVTPAYPYSPVTVTVRARSKLPGAEVVLRYKVNPEAGERVDAWPRIVMTPRTDDPEHYTATWSGRDMGYVVNGVPTTVGYYVHTVNDAGRTVYYPAQDDPVCRIRVGCAKTLMLTEVMPQCANVRADTNNDTSTHGWVEVYNYGDHVVSLYGLVALEEFCGKFRRYGDDHAGNQVAPGSYALLIARRPEDQGNGTFPERLAKGGGMVIIGEGANTDADVSSGDYEQTGRLSFDAVLEDESAGCCVADGTHEARVLPRGTPRFPNECGAEKLWLAPDVPAWVEWEGIGEAGNLNPAAGQAVSVWARLGWQDMWTNTSAPPEVKAVWEEAGGGRVETVLHGLRDAGSINTQDCFTAEIGTFAQGARVRYKIVATRQGATVVSPERVFSVGDERPPVTITEIGLRGQYECTAECGSPPIERMRTYVEMYNDGDAPFELAGTFLSLVARDIPVDAASHASRHNSEEWRIEGGTIPARGYAVIDLDGATTGRPSLLARYAGGAVTLYDTMDNGNGAIDRFAFAIMSEWESSGAFGRFVGEDAGEAMAPSPGEPNTPAPEIVINEVDVWTEGAHFVELYNRGRAGSSPVTLDGYKLSDGGADVHEIAAGDFEFGPGQYVAVRLGPPRAGEVTCDIAYSPDPASTTTVSVVLEKPDVWPWGGDTAPETLVYSGANVPPAGLSLGMKPNGSRVIEGGILRGMTPTPAAANCVEGVGFVRETPHSPRNPQAGESVVFSVRVRDACSATAGNVAGSIKTVQLEYRQDETQYPARALTAGELVGEYRTYSVSVSGLAAGRVVRYVISAVNPWDREKTYLTYHGERIGRVAPWSDAFVFTMGCGASDVAINEVAVGDGGFVELVATGGAARDVSGMALEVSADGAIVAIDTIPEGTVVPAEGFLVIERAALPQAGSLRLTDSRAAGGCSRDAVQWAALPEGRSWGRVPDGSGTFGACLPTPLGPNEIAATLFIRGDCNEDDVLDARSQAENADMAALLAYLRGEAATLQCEDRCDINDDGALNFSDVTYFLRHYFYAATPALPLPFPSAGLDPTPDGLRCE